MYLISFDNLKEAVREDTSTLPVPDAKFQEAKSGYLGQLIVTQLKK